MARRILVTVGPSDISKEVVEYADAYCMNEEADLFIIHVIEEDQSGYNPKDVFDTFLGNLKLKSPNITVLTPRGSPTEEIINAINNHKIEMVVMGAHSHTLLGEWMLGSVSKYVLHHSPCPVFLYKRPPKEFNSKIVVPINYNDINEKVIQKADEFAAQTNGQLALIHVEPDDFYYSGWSESNKGDNSPQNPFTHHTNSVELLKKFSRYLKSQKIQSSYEYTVAFGRPYAKIIEYQNNLKAGLIMMACHSHNTISRFFIGGNTDKIVHRSNCSVYVYRESILEIEKEAKPNLEAFGLMEGFGY